MTYYYAVGWCGYEDRDSVTLSHDTKYSELELEQCVEQAYSTVLRRRLKTEQARDKPDFIFADYSFFLSDVAEEMEQSLGFSSAERDMTCAVIAPEYRAYSTLDACREIEAFNDTLEADRLAAQGEDK